MQSYGIVLHSLRYGDTRMIVDIFTESAGVVSFILPATRNRKGGMRAIAWQPLSLVEVIWEARPRTALQKPKSLVLWHPWRSLHIDPRKTAIGLYLSEVLHHALRREQENRPLFLFIVNALTWFDESERNYVNFHIVFLLHLTRFLGFLPNVEDWHEGDFFDLMYVNQHIADKQYAFMRQADKENMLVVINFADKTAHCNIVIPDHAIDYFGIERREYEVEDIFADSTIKTGVYGEHSVPVEVAPYGARIFKMKL